MKYIGYVAIDIQFARLRQKDRDQGLVFIDMYDLPNTDLSAYVGLIITNYVDEDFMMAHKRLFEDYLNNGGVIFSFAEMSQSYLPNAPIWYRSPIATMFEGIDPYDLNYRRGVKGFFTRGYFKELPDGAEVIVEDQLGAPIIYVDRASTNGTLFVGSGTDLYQVYRDEESSANRLPAQILDTIREEYASRKGAHV